ncbi:hypothetical protein EKP33_04395 [Campylobacter upsaliensis]|nr:hypothetical protein [Campylobacter upsaliensis]
MLKRVLGKANSKQNRAFCKAAEWALARLKGKIWLNAEHLGGCAFRFLLRRCLATHRTGCERYALEATLRRIYFA